MRALDAGFLIALVIILAIIASSCAPPTPEPQSTPPHYTATPTATYTPTPRLEHSDAPDLIARSESRPVKIIEPTPTPTSTPAPVRAVAWNPQPQYVAGVEQWRELVASIFPADTVQAVLTVMNCESGGDPGVTGAAGEKGLMQIHPQHPDDTYDPVGNLLAAFRISSGGVDWSAWTCKPW